MDPRDLGKIDGLLGSLSRDYDGAISLGAPAPGFRSNTLQSRYAPSAHAQASPDDWAWANDAGQQAANSFIQAAKDLKTGYLTGAAGFYDTLGNAIGLVNRGNDHMTRLTGVGQMSDGTIWKDAENFLHDTAARVAPREEDLPQSIPGKIYAGLGQAPVEALQYVLLMRWLGLIPGAAAVGAVRSADQGPMAMLTGAVRDGLFGGAARAVQPLMPWMRTGILGGLGAANTAASGGSFEDIVANAGTMGLLGLPDIPIVPRGRENLYDQYLGFRETRQKAPYERADLRAISKDAFKRGNILINNRVGYSFQPVAREVDRLQFGAHDAPYIRVPGFRTGRRPDHGLGEAFSPTSSIVEVKSGRGGIPKNQAAKDEKIRRMGREVIYRRESDVIPRVRDELGPEALFDEALQWLGTRGDRFAQQARAWLERSRRTPPVTPDDLPDPPAPRGYPYNY